MTKWLKPGFIFVSNRLKSNIYFVDYTTKIEYFLNNLKLMNNNFFKAYNLEILNVRL